MGNGIAFDQSSTIAGYFSEDVAVPIRGAELFVAGMVNGLLKGNDIPELENCLSVSDKVAANVAHIIQAFFTIDINSIIKGVEECVGIVLSLPKELEACTDLGYDGERIVKWA